MKIKWKDGEKWIEFPVMDIWHLSRDHFIDLFNRNIPMIARKDSTIVTNDKDMMITYAKKGMRVVSLDCLERSERPLCDGI